jgi:hypothetical protein
VVERDQVAVALEGVEAAGAPAEPASRGFVFEGFAVARKVGAHVVEHPVEQDAQPAVVRLGDQMVEVGVVAEAWVDAVVVGGVVAVGTGREDRAEGDPRCAQGDRVIEPVDDAAQAMLLGTGRPVGRKSADETQRVDLPPDRVLNPRRLTHGRNFAW